MTASIKALSAVAGMGLTGGLGYLYYNKEQATKSPPPSQVKSAASSQPYDRLPYTLLTPDEIDNRLRAGQIVNKSPLARVRAIYTVRMASNKPVEDNYSVNTIDGNKLIAGVYDGMFYVTT